MAIIMLFELTLDYQIIIPLMLACVVAHYVSRAFQPKSIYAESLKRKGDERIEHELSSLRVSDLMKKDPISVREDAPFVDIAQNFILNRFNYLYVVDAKNAFTGAICLHDVKAYLNSPEIARLVIARDLAGRDFRPSPPTPPCPTRSPSFPSSTATAFRWSATPGKTGLSEAFQKPTLSWRWRNRRSRMRRRTGDEMCLDAVNFLPPPIAPEAI